jgi:hypothetical protein
MVSGLGVAGAVLAAVVVTFTLASGIVAYSLTSSDPLTPSSNTLVLESRAGKLAAKPLVLHRATAAATAARNGSSPFAAAAAGGAGPGVARGSLTADRGRGGSNPGPNGPGDDASTPGTAGQPGPVSPPRKPVGAKLGTTTQRVGATTDSLARRLRAVTAELATQTQPLADGTRDAVRNTVGTTTGTLARLLGSHPAR